MTDVEASPGIKKVFWQDIRSTVSKKNPKLAQLIDALNPDNSYCFYLCNYHYGERLFVNGQLYLPGNIERASFPEDLNYSYFPLGLILDKSIEVYINSSSSMLPIRAVSSGEILGLWETLQPNINHGLRCNWNICSGARSSFMLPKVTDANSHVKLRRSYGIKTSVPKNVSQHWQIFKEIVESKSAACDWGCQLLFFNAKWLEPRNDVHWERFHSYLYKDAWRQTLAYRNKEVLNYYWEELAIALSQKNLKPKPHLIDTFKHIFCLALGYSPGFRPADSSTEVALPVKTIQKAYIEAYGLKNYIPTIMQPQHYDITQSNKPIYYSMQSPTLIETYPKPKIVNSILSDLRELKNLMRVVSEQLHLEDTMIYRIFNTIQIDYFHTEVDELDGIRPSADIAREDEAFLECDFGGERIFSDNSPFMRGCIRIKKA